MLERSEKCRIIVGNVVTSLLVCSRNAGNLKLFVRSSQSELETKNHSESKVNTMKFPQDPNLKREWFIKMKRIALLSCPFVQNILPKVASNKLFYYRKEFCWDPLSSFVNLYSGKTRYRRFLTSLWKVTIRQLDKNQRKTSE